MEENVVQDLAFHNQTVQSDANSPLHLIREKEMEISGRVLSAKREADQIVADARHHAAAMMTAAEGEAAEQAQSRDSEVQAEVETQITSVKADAESEAATLQGTIDTRRRQAVDYVIEAVIRI